MANEKRISLSLAIVADGLTAQSTLSFQANLTGTNFVGTVISATTSWVAIPLGALASFERMMIVNQDQTNYISVALDNAGTNTFAKILPGEGIYLTPSTSTLYIKANTAACDYQLCATEV